MFPFTHQLTDGTVIVVNRYDYERALTEYWWTLYLRSGVKLSSKRGYPTLADALIAAINENYEDTLPF